ncbi:MAG: potassium channel protein [Acidimicrobiia bacterium]|nr:MAG: potassium channel protein [Acidimicrobiia bacterium]
MNLPSSLRAGVAALFIVVIVGAAGFVLLSHIGILDAVYLTLIVITTLGLGEPTILLETSTKVWLVVVLLAGMGAAIYTLTAMMEYGLEIVIGSDYRKRRRMERDVERVENHVIVCGHGRVGSTAAAALQRQGIPVVVVDSDPVAVDRAISDGFFAVEGDATRDESLVEARVHAARSLIACVESPSDNLVITLSAKALNPTVPVYARAIDSETEKKLTLAGADAVVTPELVGGERIAALATQPGLAEFVDLIVSNTASEVRIRRFVVEPDAIIVGKSLADLDLRRQGGAMVISLTSEDQPIQVNPDPETQVTAGDVVFAVGTIDQLSHLESTVSAS